MQKKYDLGEGIAICLMMSVFFGLALWRDVGGFPRYFLMTFWILSVITLFDFGVWNRFRYWRRRFEEVAFDENEIIFGDTSVSLRRPYQDVVAVIVKRESDHSTDALERIEATNMEMMERRAGAPIGLRQRMTLIFQFKDGDRANVYLHRLAKSELQSLGAVLQERGLPIQQ